MRCFYPASDSDYLSRSWPLTFGDKRSGSTAHKEILAWSTSGTNKASVVYRCISPPPRSSSRYNQPELSQVLMQQVKRSIYPHVLNNLLMDLSPTYGLITTNGLPDCFTSRYVYYLPPPVEPPHFHHYVRCQWNQSMNQCPGPPTLKTLGVSRLLYRATSN